MTTVFDKMLSSVCRLCSISQVVFNVHIMLDMMFCQSYDTIMPRKKKEITYSVDSCVLIHNLKRVHTKIHTLHDKIQPITAKAQHDWWNIPPHITEPLYTCNSKRHSTVSPTPPTHSQSSARSPCLLVPSDAWPTSPCVPAPSSSSPSQGLPLSLQQ